MLILNHILISKLMYFLFFLQFSNLPKYHGCHGTLVFTTLNQSRAFLKKLDHFQHFLDDQPDSVVLEALSYIHTFRAFDRVVSSCFGGHLKGDFQAHIQEFKRLYMLLNISITPKVLTFFYKNH